METGIKVETWKPVIEYEGLYEVSDQGRVRRITTGRILKSCPDSHGYLQVNLCRGGIQRSRGVHQLVIQAYLGPRPIDKVVNHKDGEKTNNLPENLEYVTYSENSLHAYKMGRISMPPQAGEFNGNAKLTQAKANEIRLLYSMKTLTKMQLREKFGVSKSCIESVLSYKTWRYE